MHFHVLQVSFSFVSLDFLPK